MRHPIWPEQNQAGTCPKLGNSTLFLCDGHREWSSRYSLSEDEKEEIDGKKNQAPLFVRVANVLTTTLLRAGIKLKGAGNYSMYLLTVRRRKSGQPRTIPIAIIEGNGKRYVDSVW